MSRAAGRFLLPFCAAALAACSGDFNPVRTVAVKTGIGAERKEGADFVKESRPSNLDYTPVGVAQPKPKYTAKPVAGVKGVEAEMDALRAQNEARAQAARDAAATVQPAQRPAVPPPQ